ncbi:hypothetical protein Tco_1353531 [Tanacetum coccineum]
MSQPVNDDFSKHLSDDEASYHEDASDNGTVTNQPKQQQQQQHIPTTTTISNIKLPILKKEEYDIWTMEMEHYLEYIDNDVWKTFPSLVYVLSATPTPKWELLDYGSLAQAHVFSQATQEPFHIDWYLHAQSLIPAVHMAEHIGGLESTFKIPERIECVRRATSLNFEQNKVIVSALKLNYFVLNFVPVEAIALVIKIPLMRHVKGYNHKIYLHFPRRIVLLYCLPTTHNVVRNHL